MNIKKRNLQFCSLVLFFLLIALFLVACGKPGMTLSMAGMPNVNPDRTGRPSPILIKMYELKSDLVFKQAEMLPLFGDPIATLGPDMIAFDEITLIPGEAKVIVYEANPETRYIGVLASFHQFGKGPWKIIKTINPNKNSKVALELNTSNLILISDDKTKKWDPVVVIKNYKENSSNVATSSSYSNEKPVLLNESGEVIEQESVGVEPEQAKQPQPMRRI